MSCTCQLLVPLLNKENCALYSFATKGKDMKICVISAAKKVLSKAAKKKLLDRMINLLKYNDFQMKRMWSINSFKTAEVILADEKKMFGFYLLKFIESWDGTRIHGIIDKVIYSLTLPFDKMFT